MTRDEKLNLLYSYEFPIMVEKLLMPQIEEHTKGLQCVFIGGEGTGMEECIEKIVEFLYKIEKIKENVIHKSTFGEIDLNLREGLFYNITNLAYGLRKLRIIQDSFIESNNYVASQTNNEICVNNENRNPYIAFNSECTILGNNYIDILLSNYKEKYIIITTQDIDYLDLVKLEPKMDLIFEDKVIFRDLTTEEIVEYISNTGIYRIDDIQNVVINYIEKNRDEILFKNRKLGDYIVNYMNSHLGKMPPEPQRLIGAEEKLKDIIGLEPVKEQILNFKKFLNYKNMMEKQNIKLPNQSLHMMFLGAPGTGKTTIARILTQIMFEIGLCKENKLIEVCRQDLVAGEPGQTAIKTQNAVARSMGGVLFVDEAYALASQGFNGDDAYGQEAIATLIKEMEDKKDRVIVIFAGYPKEMSLFMTANSGIASRIGYIFDFPNYTEAELYQIFRVKTKKFAIDEEAEMQVKELINACMDIKNAGNGRLVDKIVQETLMKHSRTYRDPLLLRLSSIPTEQELEATMFG